MPKGDFVGIFKARKGIPATIRFLDPPLHEFLPHEDKAQQDLAKKMGVPETELNAKTQRREGAEIPIRTATSPRVQ